jgi:hypothetical protein
LKKQSQFVPGEMSVTPYGKGAYDNNSPVGDGQNKAKQSQFDAQTTYEVAGKGEKSDAAPTG